MFFKSHLKKKRWGEQTKKKPSGKSGLKLFSPLLHLLLTLNSLAHHKLASAHSPLASHHPDIQQDIQIKHLN